MQQDQLKHIALELTKAVQENATIDWSIKETARAKLRSQINRILRRYKYPPDLQSSAVETVIKQAEMMAKELTSN
ncbi:MAG: hypothetical protein RLZZ293_517 [Pseudomonadota bacterium]|jgi:type I restriction enzyme R subunit